MEKEIKVDLSNAHKEAKITLVNGCSICTSSSLCLLDGIVPDFEVAGVTLVFGVLD